MQTFGVAVSMNVHSNLLMPWRTIKRPLIKFEVFLREPGVTHSHWALHGLSTFSMLIMTLADVEA